jgi:hypothetical protein
MAMLHQQQQYAAQYVPLPRIQGATYRPAIAGAIADTSGSRGSLPTPKIVTELAWQDGSRTLMITNFTTFE